MTRSRGDEGFSTVLAAGLVLVLFAVTTAVGALGTLVAVRHRVAAVADLAALAAAQHALEGPEVACRRARELAEAHRVTVRHCALEGLDAVVEVGVLPPGRLAGLGEVRRLARAGRR